MPIPLDSLTLTFLARDLDRRLRGHAIDAVSIGEDKLLAIHLAEREPGFLWFLYDPGLPLVCVAEHPPARSGMARAPRFEDALRGATITRVEQLDLERVIKLEATHGSEGRADRQDRSSGPIKGLDRQVFHLYFELAPPFPNLFLTDRDDTLVAILLRAGTKTRRRQLVQGEPYVAPASQAKANPLEVTAETLDGLAWRKDDGALSKAVLGIGPFTSSELTARAKKRGSLAEAFFEMLAAYKAARAAPHVFGVSPALSKHAPPIGLAWYRPTLEDIHDVKAMPSINAAAEFAIRAFLRTSAFDRKKASLERGLAKEIARWEAVARDAERARKGMENAAELRRWGELILANLGKLRKGASEARLPDIYTEKAGEVLVPLEQRLTPHANADAYFKRARRAERSARLAEETLRRARGRLRQLAALLGEVREASQTGTPEATQTRLSEIEKQYGRTAAPGGEPEKEEETDQRAAALGIRPRRFVVADGWIVLVGRSAEENDILTHKYSSPSDLWFHARQAHGSHVVLRRERRKTEPSKQAIIEAARIAAYYSKAKNSKHVPVSYAERRYVKKVRKGAPGLAVMLREKVLFVNPAPPPQRA